MKKKLSNILIATIVLTTGTSPMTAGAAGTAVVKTTTVNATELSDLHLADEWAREAVQQAKANGLMTGDPSGQFRPQDSITRQEIAVVLAKALKIEMATDSQSVFSDVPASHWANGSIEALYNAGIISGDGTGQFRPQDPVTREELAVLLVKALFTSPTNTGLDLPFADKGKIGVWAQNYVQTAFDHGLMRGDGTNFNPSQQAKRQEVALIVTNFDRQSTISAVTDDQVMINGVSYGVADELKGIFNKRNSAILEGAKLKFALTGRIVNQVTYLEITHGGQPAKEGEAEFSNNLVLDANDAMIQGNLKIGANYITLKNLKVAGLFEIGKALQNDFYSENLQVTGETIVNGGDTNTVVFNNANLTGTMRINKENVRVEPQGSTKVSEVVVNSNATITADAGVTIPKLTVGGGANSVEINASVDELKVTGTNETTLTGNSTIKTLKVETTQPVALNTTGSIATLELTNSKAQLNLREGTKVDNLVLPSGTKASDVIPNYSLVKGQFTNINNDANPDNTPAPAPTTPAPSPTSPGTGTTPPPVVSAQLTGRVVNEAQAPVANATVHISKENGFHTSVVTDVQGVYRINGLTQSGPYFIYAAPTVNSPDVMKSLTAHFSFDPAQSNRPPLSDLVLQNVDLRGQITGPDGTPAADADVVIYQTSISAAGNYSKEIDVNGNYKIGGLEVDTSYVLYASPSSEMDAVQSLSQQFVYQPGQAPRNLQLANVQVEGVVLTPEGLPAASVAVVVSAPASIQSEVLDQQVILTDAQGRYKFGNLIPDVEYSMYLFPEPAQEKAGVLPLETSFTYTGQRTTLKDLRLERQNLTGTVYTAPGVTAPGGVPVEIVGVGTSFRKVVKADNNSQFHVRLEDGTYHVLALAPQWLYDYVDSQRLTITVQDGVANVTSADLTLEQAMLKGYAKNIDGQAYANASVTVRDVTGFPVLTGNTSEDGEFRLGHLSDGDYYLDVVPYGSTISLKPVSFTVTNQTPVSLGVVQFQEYPQITGQVVGNGVGVPGRKVLVYDENFDLVQDGVVTDQDGMYEIYDLTEGNYYLEVYVSEDEMLVSERIPFTYNNERLNYNIALEEIDLAGVVVDVDGYSVEGAEVTLRVTDDSEPSVSITTTWNGRFIVADLVEGKSYELIVQPPSGTNWEPIMVSFEYNGIGGIILEPIVLKAAEPAPVEITP